MKNLSWVLLVVLLAGCAVTPHQPKGFILNPAQQSRILRELDEFRESELLQKELEEQQKAQERKRKIRELWA